MNTEFDRILSKSLTTQDLLKSLRLFTNPEPSYERLLKKAEIKLKKVHAAIGSNDGVYDREITDELCRMFVDIGEEVFYRMESVTMGRKDEERPPTMRRRLKRVDADVDLGELVKRPVGKGAVGGRPVIVKGDEEEWELVAVENEEEDFEIL